MLWDKVRRQELLIFGVLMMVFLGLVFIRLVDFYLDHEMLDLVDIPIYGWILGIRGRFLNQIMIMITLIGNWQMILWGVFLCCLLLAATNRFRYLIAMIISNGVAFVFSESVKILLTRPRPPISNAIIFADGYSFPSGHSSFAVIFYGLVVYFWFKHFKSKTLKTLTLILGGLFVIILGFSRIYLGVHWTTDVIAGFCSSGVWLLLTILYLEYRKKEFGLKWKQFDIKDVHLGMLAAGVLWLGGLLLLYQQYAV